MPATGSSSRSSCVSDDPGFTTAEEATIRRLAGTIARRLGYTI
jgi:hypothetical protein